MVAGTGLNAVAVVAAGWLLGGTLGPATVLYAPAIGPLVHLLLPRRRCRGPPAQVSVSRIGAGRRCSPAATTGTTATTSAARPQVPPRAQAA